MTSPQRYLNKQSIYIHENNFMLDFKIGQLINLLETSIEVCTSCMVNKKNHYCVEPKCKKKELICVECDCKDISSDHYMHDYTYVLPLLSKDIYNNFQNLKTKFSSFHKDVQEEINKIQDYLKELITIKEISLRQLKQLEQEESYGRMNTYIESMEYFLKNKQKTDKIKDILNNVRFISTQQCLQKQESMKNELLVQINNLKWPKDPQKNLKQKLKYQQNEEKRDIFISTKKQLQIAEIDANFRTNYQFFTFQLSNHKIDIKIQNDLLSKIKFYESMIYHFKDCTRLCIENGTINHIRTPLTFRKLKQFQFNCNAEAETQNIRLQNLNDELVSFTIRRYREEDTKLLKYITNQCKNLKSLHIQFSNKVDLYSSKDLNEYLKFEASKNLNKFVLKIRTESEVKRLYGYLTKFYRDTNQNQINLGVTLVDLLNKNKNLTNIAIEGVKPLDIYNVLLKMKQMPFLMDFKIYYENIDLMTEIDSDEVKKLEQLCYKRKRIFYALAKSSKYKYYGKDIMDYVFTEFLI